MIFSHMYTPCTGHTILPIVFLAIKLPIFVSYKCSLTVLRTGLNEHTLAILVLVTEAPGFGLDTNYYYVIYIYDICILYYIYV